MKFTTEDGTELINIIVVWIDAYHENGECKTEELSSVQKGYVSGWYVGEGIAYNTAYLSIALEYFDCDKGWRQISHIPKCLIKNIIGLNQ